MLVPPGQSFLRPLPFDPATYSRNATNNFKLPPLDGSLTVPEMYEWHFQHNPRQVLFKYENDRAGFVHLTYSDIVPAAHRAATYAARAISIDLDNMPEKIPTIAIAATSDTVTHFCVLLGLIIAGIPYIKISPHNSAAVIAHLATQVNANYIFYSSEPSIDTLVHNASEIMRSSGNSAVCIPMPKYENVCYHGDWPAIKPRKYDPDSPALFSHSSGSTSLPKPIPWTHAFMLQCAMAPLFGSVNFYGEVFACHSASMSHGSGVHLLPWMPTSGLIAAVFPPASPAKYPSPEATFQGCARAEADYVFTFPSMIEIWSTDPTKFDALRKVKGLIYVGSMLNKPAGDLLVEHGIKAFPLFGMAEAGVVGDFLPPYQHLDWEYFPLTAHSGGQFIDAGDDLHELVIVEQQFKRLPVPNMRLNGANAYASRDLFVEHPTKPGYWRVLGRKDDRITHPNGEKTNPALMEHILASDPQVKSAIVFGDRRNQTGVLIQLKDGYLFDPNDTGKLADFQAYLRPKLAEANAVAANYSTLYPEMVLVTHPSKPFEYTEKGSIRRKAVLQAYHFEVEQLYISAEQRVLSGVIPPKDWSFEEVLVFVQRALKAVGLDVPENEDIFFYGCNSLHATRIETIIRNALKRTDTCYEIVGDFRHFVYNYPTPHKLSEFLLSLAQRRMIEPEPENSSGVRDLEELVRELIEDIFHNVSTHKSISDKVQAPAGHANYLLTGATGTLGSHLLMEAIRDPTVSRIFVLMRDEPGSSLEPHLRSALSDKGIDPELAIDPKVTLLSSNLAEPAFGLDNTAYKQLEQSVTHIFHLAWNINWNLPIAHFKVHLLGVKNIIQFVLASKLLVAPKLLFSSTIGVHRNTGPETPAFELPLESLASATGQGYSESKAVAEQVLGGLAKLKVLRPTIVRFGQISGGCNGFWRTSDWFPAMVKSSIAVRGIPKIPGVASFVPAKHAGEILNEIRDSEASVLHITHPSPIPLNELLQHYTKVLDCPAIPYEDWLRRLETLESTATTENFTRAPALSLLDFFRESGARMSKYGSGSGEILGLVTLRNEVCATASPLMKGMKPIGVEEADKWLTYWRSVGFL